MAVRATANGAKAYIYQGKLDGKDIRITIGSPSTWTIDAAQAEARRLQVMVDNEQDPRQVKAEQQAAAQSARDAKAAATAALVAQEARDSITLGSVGRNTLTTACPTGARTHYLLTREQCRPVARSEHEAPS